MISKGNNFHRSPVLCHSTRSALWVKVVCSLLVIVLVGCGDEEKSSESDHVYEGVELVQVDSIMIPVMGNLRVFDYSPEQGLFLAADVPDAMLASMPGGPSKNELGILLINESGQVVHQFNRSNEGPEGHGTSAGDIFFAGEDRIGVLSQRGLFEYDFEGNLQHRYKSLHSRNMVGSPNYSITEVGSNGNMAMANPKLTARIYDNWDSLYLLAKPLEIYDLNELKKQDELNSARVSEAAYPSIPIYQPDSKQLTIEMAPRVSMNAESQEVSLLFHEHPYLFVFSMNNGELLREVDLQPEYFGDYVALPATEGQAFYDWLNFGGWMANSYYHDLVQLGDYTLMRYNPAMSSSKLNELVNAKGPRSYELWPAMRKKDYNFRYQLFKGDEKVVPDFLLPDLEPNPGQRAFNRHDRLGGSIIGGDGLEKVFVFIPNDGEEERDYQLIRVYKLKML